jgi:energy-coupling factor transporter ATP-binding protein EcfA2
METIQIKNLRLLEDTGQIDLKPITVLLGGNGSGKSTFLRAFPLLKQSIELRTSSPILWYAGEGGYVDFGSFNEAVLDFDPTQKISFGFSANLSSQGIFYTSEQSEIDFHILCEISLFKERNLVSSYSIYFGGHEVKMSLEQNGMITSLMINDNNFSDDAKNFKNIQVENMIPYFTNAESTVFLPSLFGRMPFPSFFFRKSLIEKIKSQISGKPSDETAVSIIERIGYKVLAEKEILELLSNSSGPKTWRKKVLSWTHDTPIYKEIRDLFVAYWCFILLERFKNYFTQFSQNISYSKPLRATAERYYRYQDLAIREVEANGDNLAMFIKGLQDEKDNRLELF